MANKKTDMSKLRQMLRLYAQGESKLKISDLTGVSRNTLKKYLKIYVRLGLSLPDFDENRSDQELDHLFGESLLPEPSDRYKTLEPFFPKMEKELEEKRYDTPYSMGKVHCRCIRMAISLHSLNIIISSGSGAVNRLCILSTLQEIRCILTMQEKNFIL